MQIAGASLPFPACPGPVRAFFHDASSSRTITIYQVWVKEIDIQNQTSANLEKRFTFFVVVPFPHIFTTIRPMLNLLRPLIPARLLPRECNATPPRRPDGHAPTPLRPADGFPTQFSRQHDGTQTVIPETKPRLPPDTLLIPYPPR